MEFLQELFLTACMAVVFSLIVAASIAFSGGNEKASSVVVKMEEKRLKVVGVKSKKKVKFMDEVVVRDVDCFDVEEKPSNDLNFLENFDWILEKSLEEEISRDEVNIVKMIDPLDEEEAEVIVSSGSKIVEEIGNVKLADVEEKACKGFQLIDEVLEKGIENKKTGYAEVFESNHFEGNSHVGSGSSEMLPEIDSVTGLNMVDDDVSTNQKDAEEGGKDCISAVALLGETLKRGAFEERNQSTDISINTDNGVKEREISAFDGGLENLSVGENSRNRALGGESKVERLSDSGLPENEEDGGLCEESNVVATKAEEGTVRHGEFKKDKEDGGLCEESNVVAAKAKAEEGTVGHGEFEKDKEDDDDDDDDDWEGIERSELEKVFAKAVNYVEYGGKDKDDQQLSNNVQIQLYGLHKLAVEGPCYEPQPMALKVSSRAKWNSWQKLGSMSPELAMEQYIKLLSEADSQWAYHPHAGGLSPSGAVRGPGTSLAMPKELQADDEEGERSQVKDPEMRPTI